MTVHDIAHYKGGEHATRRPKLLTIVAILALISIPIIFAPEATLHHVPQQLLGTHRFRFVADEHRPCEPTCKSTDHTDFCKAVGNLNSYFSNNGDEVNSWWDYLEIQSKGRRGIIVSAGERLSLSNAFISLYVIRNKLHSKLPAVIMYWGLKADDVPTQETMDFFKEHISDVEFIDLSSLNYPTFQPPLFEEALKNTSYKYQYSDGWKIKVFGIYSAPFDEILYLDGDAMPLVKPDVLFENSIYLEQGNMFFSDLWCGNCGLRDIFNIPDRTGIPQAESGILVINKLQHRDVLEWVLFLNSQSDVVYKMVYGDKDTFMGAFQLACKYEQYMQTKYRMAVFLDQKKDWAMRGLAQFIPNGTLFAVHRVSNAKYDIDSDTGRPITSIAMPSCDFYAKHGWNADRIPSEQLAVNNIFRTADKRKKQGCDYSMHQLADSAMQCGKYDTFAINNTLGETPLPVFEVDGYVKEVLEEYEEVYAFLHDTIKRNNKVFPKSS